MQMLKNQVKPMNKRIKMNLGHCHLHRWKVAAIAVENDTNCYHVAIKINPRKNGHLIKLKPENKHK